MKEFNVKFKEVTENEIIIPARTKKEAFEKAIYLFNNSELKDLEITNITKHYDIIDVNKIELLKKERKEDDINE